MSNVIIRIKTLYNGKGIKQANKDFGDISSFLQKGLAAFGIGLGAKELANFAINTVKAADQAKVATTAFTSLSGSANIAAVNLAAMDRATKGLVSDTEQMKIANQLLGMRIVETGDQLEEVVGVSRRLGKEFRGLGAEEAANEFAIMVSNMSVARLDSFGISSGRVRNRINELLATTENMTREQAFFQATMEEGQATMERLGPEVATTSGEVSRLGAEWANLVVVMGQAVEKSGAIKSLSGIFADQLVVLRNWSEAGTDAATKQEALEIKIRRVKKAIEDSQSGIIQSTAMGNHWRELLGELEVEYAAVTEEINRNTEAGKKEQEQLQARIRSEEIAAENLAKRKEAAKKFGETQEQFARDIVDLQRATDSELRDLQDQFVDDSLEVEEKHFDQLADIRKKAAKDAAKDAKRLQKDLAKVDSNLKKDLIKQQIDEDKEIINLQQRAVKEERQTRQRKKIDALSDERLFQFELRQLAAEGQGNAIKEALERREIEQQIASEKAEFEKSVEKEKKNEQIQTIREEGRERRTQLEQQAAERKADLELRAQEEAEARAERLAEERTEENEAYLERRADLKEFLSEQTEVAKESENERIQEMARGLMEAEELTSTQLGHMIELAKEFGPKFGEAFADGVAEGFGENFRIDEAIEKATADIGAGAGPLPVASESSSARGGIMPFQSGGIIGRSGLAMVHSGEEIANPAIGQAVVIGGEQFAVREAARLAAAINAQRQRDLQSLVDNLSELMN